MKVFVDGVPIFRQINSECPYFHSNFKEKKFDLCVCPVGKSIRKIKNGSMILGCATELTDCVIYNSQNENHINIVKKYIDKINDDWILITTEHWQELMEKTEAQSDEYLKCLFSFFHYKNIQDEHVDGVLFTNKVEK